MSGSGSGSDSVSRESLPAAEALVDVGDRVYFGYDQYDLSAEARATLEKQAALLRKYPAVDIIIQGHADERGTLEYNLALGERRANSAKDYLVALGINPARIRTVSYGEERPAMVGSTESAFAQNRRAVTVVAGGEPSS
jgi:peptidoglycan-associated lipoprotein